MRRPEPLPRDLSAEFTAAAALGHGASPGRLRARDLDAGVHGVRSSRSAGDDHRVRLRLFQLRLPHVIASHISAAIVHAIPVPKHLEHGHVHLAAVHPERAPHAKGIIGHTLQLGDDDILEEDGDRITSAERTWIDLGGILPFPDLVAAGDALLAKGLCSRERVVARLDEHRGARGIRRLRTAALMLNARSESPQESRLRAVLMAGGLREPSVNHEIYSAAGFVARVDLAYIDRRIAIEYQGDYHRDRAQWRADQARRTRVEALGWTVLELAADDLRDPRPAITRLRALLR